MNQDLEPVRDVLTDEMFNMYLMQLDTLIDNNQKNMMEDIRFVRGYRMTGYSEDGQEHITMVMIVNCRDYVQDANGYVVRGDRNIVWTYVYELQFVRSVSAPVSNCPSCGSSLSETNGNKCPYCGNTVFAGNGKMKLAKKRMIEQRRGY